jgi:hypothetical protein
MGSMAERPNSKAQMRPWKGSLLPPRISPERSINDGIAKTIVSQSSTYSCPSAVSLIEVVDHRNWGIGGSEKEVQVLNEICDSNELLFAPNLNTQRPTKCLACTQICRTDRDLLAILARAGEHKGSGSYYFRVNSWAVKRHATMQNRVSDAEHCSLGIVTTLW